MSDLHDDEIEAVDGCDAATAPARDIPDIPLA